MTGRGVVVDLVSDTHGQHDRLQLRGGDILVHAGDVSRAGRPAEIRRFVEWFAQQRNYTHRVFVPGNHDFDLESDTAQWTQECSRLGIHMLVDSGVSLSVPSSVEYEVIKVWGSPVQPWFQSWAFNRSRRQEDATKKHPWIKPHWDVIPADTEILITHGPPHGILDEVADDRENVGCECLTERVEQLRDSLKLHVFGHIHEARGIKQRGTTLFANASCLDSHYHLATRTGMRVVRTCAADRGAVYSHESECLAAKCCTFHTLAESSPHTDKIQRPSGDQLGERSQILLGITCTHAPLSASHTRMESCLDADAIHRASGDQLM